MNWSRHSSINGRGLKGPWGPKQTPRAVAILLALALAFMAFMPGGRSKNLNNSNGCDFPAIFNFGDSNSDTGGLSAAFRRLPYPNGYSFFNKPSGRCCDGRDIIDFIAEKLELPYLSAYLDSIRSNFRHGANFATAGSTIQPIDGRIFESGFSPFSLDIQVLQFEQFKERTLELYNQGRITQFEQFKERTLELYNQGRITQFEQCKERTLELCNQGRSSDVTISLPRPEDFSKALYTFDIGQNDLHYGIQSMTEKQLVEYIPSIINLFAQAVEKLYQLGAKTFWIHNTGPIGCLPYDLTLHPPKDDNVDKNGCAMSHNAIAQEFNKQLKNKVYELRKQLPDAVLTYTDVYTAKYSLISEAKELGFADPLGYCCEHFGDFNVGCGEKAMVNGTEISGDLCSNPRLYISWDGVHYSEAANQIIANRILDGCMSEPSNPIWEACHKLV